jgi:hypothetical protein
VITDQASARRERLGAIRIFLVYMWFESSTMSELCIKTCMEGGRMWRSVRTSRYVYILLGIWALDLWTYTARVGWLVARPINVEDDNLRQNSALARQGNHAPSPNSSAKAPPWTQLIDPWLSFKNEAAGRKQFALCLLILHASRT